jgi:hypothetical protein
MLGWRDSTTPGDREPEEMNAAIARRQRPPRSKAGWLRRILKRAHEKMADAVLPARLGHTPVSLRELESE